VLTVEARDRIGGRCDTRRLPGIAAPVELGAEFIHGRPEATLALLQKANIAAIDTTRTQRVLFDGKLRAVDVFAEARKSMRRKPPLTDVSFQKYLSGQKLSPLSRALATMMVQGFDAADPRDASALAIVEEWGTALTASHMRPQGGYLPLLKTLGVQVQLQTEVRELRWSRGSVEVSGTVRGEPWTATAARAVITLPLGVLQSGAVRFIPELDKPLDKLVSGPVIRVALAFADAFWEKDHPGTAFFHNPGAPFPTFWTPLPMHAPLLTAWAGGPKAERLAGKNARDLQQRAMASVRSVLGRSEDPLACLVQDWQADPYARGGYSYIKVGGTGAREMLQSSLEATLYFAGEATDVEEAGTVGGALASGQRAAREILAA
jgi:monoamine oxidase